VSISSIRRIEACDGLPDSTSVKVLHAIQAALEAAGLEFIGTAEQGAGVRFADKPLAQTDLFHR
jgi:hypothetical protein